MAEKQPSPLVQAYEQCKDKKVGNPLVKAEMIRASETMTVDDTSLVIEGGGDQFASGQAAACVLSAVDAPVSVVRKIETTNALMGREDDAWGDFEASWSFHPDNGLDLILETVDNG